MQNLSTSKVGNPNKTKVAGYLMLDDLESIYKKLPDIERPELEIDFKADFGQILFAKNQ